MGILVVVALTVFMGLAATSVARQLDHDRSRSLLLVRSGIIVHVLIIVPSYMLGLYDLLTPLNMALCVLGLSTVLVAVAAVRDGGPAAYLDAERANALRFLRWPLDLKRAFRHAPFPLWVGVSVALALLMWIGFAVLVSPPRGNSDAFFYHEPIVAFMIQNKGMDVVNLPWNLQRINGMPRFCHFLQLWFALFTGRSLVELPNVLSHPLAITSIYGLCQRVGIQKSSAIAWAFCFTLIPGVLRLTDVVMIDVQTAAMVLAACCLTIRPRLTVANAIVAACAIALLCGTKLHMYAIAGALSLILGLRTLAMAKHRTHPWSVPKVGGVVVVTAGIVLLAATAVLFRNYLLFENPVHPFGLNIKSLGLTFGHKNSLMSGKGIMPWNVWDKWFHAPFAVKPWLNPSARVEDYGLAFVFITLPISLIAPFIATFRALQLRVRRQRIPDTLWAALAVSFVWALSYATFPAIVRGRYYLGVIGLTFVLTGWLLSTPGRKALGRQLAFTSQVLMIISVVWSTQHGWVTEPFRVIDRLGVPANERDFTSRMLMGTTPELGHARNEKLTAGKTIGFFQGKLIGVWWNDDYSSRVVWLGDETDLEAAEKAAVDWMYLYFDTLGAMDDPLTENWAYIGHVMTGRRGVPPGRMYERSATAPPLGTPIIETTNQGRPPPKKPRRKKQTRKKRARKTKAPPPKAPPPKAPPPKAPPPTPRSTTAPPIDTPIAPAVPPYALPSANPAAPKKALKPGQRRRGER